MCVICSTSNEHCHFSLEKRDSAKRVVDFTLERDTFRNKIMEIVEDFDEKTYNNNGKPLKSSRILRVNPIFFHFSSCFSIFRHVLSFSFIFHFFHFFIFFHFLSISFNFHFISFIFSFIFSHFLSCSFIFYHFLSFSFFILFHSLPFSFSFCRGGSKSDFLGPQISLRFLLTILT